MTPKQISAALIASVLVMLPRDARAQRTSETYYACYAPPSGVVYRIRATGAPTDCVEANHVEFSWTSRSVAPGGAEPTPSTRTQGGGAPTVPAGAVMFFDATACPSGWTAFDAARGRAIVGMPSDGALNGTVGAPLANLEDRQHTHSLEALELTSSTNGVHSHRLAGGTWGTSGNGNHSHVWATKSAADIWRDGLGQRIVDWTDGMSNDGDGQYPISTSDGGSLTLSTSMSGLHSHQITLPDRIPGENGDHQHTTGVPERTGSAAGTASVMPYLQLLVCRKS